MKARTFPDSRIADLAKRIFEHQLSFSQLFHADLSDEDGEANWNAWARFCNLFLDDYQLAEKALREKEQQFAQSLNADQQAALNQIREDRTYLQTIDLRAAFDLGKRAALMVRGTGHAFERFNDAAQANLGQRAMEDGTLTDAGIQHALERIGRATPAAQAVVTFSNPLNATNTAIGQYVNDEVERATQDAAPAWDPNHEGITLATTVEAHYAIGLVVGLMLADVV